MTNLKSKQEDKTDEDLCITCLGLSNPPEVDTLPEGITKQEQDGGFKIGWY